MKFGAKNKIMLVLALWVAASFAMVGYFFGILSDANQQTLGEITAQRQEMAQLSAERDSYQLAKQDLTQLQAKALQPEDFFSKDVTLVNEIKTLENLGQKLNVDFNLSGLSGTMVSAPKAKTQSEIFAVPYSINLLGDFSDIVAFIETMENLDFITTLSTLSISSTVDNKVVANLTANFYLRQQ
jgi:Tfp pilus assembly protein PilO